MRSCPVKDRMYVSQCGKCLRYNHKTTTCKCENHVCAWCAEEHKSNECPSKDDTAIHKCVNCKRNDEADIKHNAYDRQCPWRIRVKDQLIRRTDWGDVWPSL